MCTLFDKRVLYEDTIVFKIVNADRSSKYHPEGRSRVEVRVKEGGIEETTLLFEEKGSVLHYPKGTVVKSPYGPGIMGYEYKSDASYRCDVHREIIKLKIRKGIIVWQGSDLGHPILCAPEVEVIS